jgi:hypothetical protein
MQPCLLPHLIACHNHLSHRRPVYPPVCLPACATTDKANQGGSLGWYLGHTVNIIHSTTLPPTGLCLKGGGIPAPHNA